jgi:UDP-galactopyranose mutase
VAKPILIVGAGFAGATYARELAEKGFRVDVIDRRPHVAGNAYDEIDATGVRIHRYGPHLFHTNNERVVEWLTRFGSFVPYEHKVQAELADGRCVSVPINRRTIEAVFGVRLESAEAAAAFLQRQAIPNEAPANAGEYLAAHIGVTLTDLFFRPYTRKMWALDLEELDAAVVKRIPIRTDDEDRYFPTDRFQMLPRDGYTQLFRSILDYPSIRVTVGQPFDKSMLGAYLHCFNSMAIDEYFDHALGALPYRSMRFHHSERPADYARGEAAVINFTDAGRFVRETDWSRLPAHRVAAGRLKTVTREEPCDYTENNFERFYPVKSSDGCHGMTYRRYKQLAAKLTNVTFIGRCGTYQYLDMHQVINQSLAGARGWIAQHD